MKTEKVLMPPEQCTCDACKKFALRGLPPERDGRSFTADWTATWTPEEAEKELRESGFRFSGEGWYFRRGDTLLVVPVGEGKFRFYVYTGRNPGDMFNWIVNAPIRSDDR